MAATSLMFATRSVTFGEGQVDVLLQNSNGPCPLLAIANILLLRRKLVLPKSARTVGVTTEDLLQLLGNYIMESNVPPSDVERQADFHQQLTDALSILPSLARGVDVNVRFRSPTDFEFTPELSVFDMCGVALRHGWLFDPQDVEVARAIGAKSYNQLVETLVLMDEALSPSQQQQQQQQRQQQGMAVTVPVVPPPPITAEILSSQGSDDDISSGGGEGSAGASAAAAVQEQEVQEDAEEKTSSAENENNKNNGGDGAFVDESEVAVAVTADEVENAGAVVGDVGAECSEESSVLFPLPPPVADEQQEQVAAERRPASGASPAASPRTRLTQEGLIIQQFLSNTASQLTYHGLAELHSSLKPGEFCVFFRNNHFSTMYMNEGRELFVLETDVGYLHEPSIVWQKLAEVDGDCQFYTGGFIPFQPHATGGRKAPRMKEMEDADAQLALQMQQMEYKQAREQEQQQHRQSVQPPPQSRNSTQPPQQQQQQQHWQQQQEQELYWRQQQQLRQSQQPQQQQQQQQRQPQPRPQMQQPPVHAQQRQFEQQVSQEQVQQQLREEQYWQQQKLRQQQQQQQRQGQQQQQQQPGRNSSSVDEYREALREAKKKEDNKCVVS